MFKRGLIMVLVLVSLLALTGIALANGGGGATTQCTDSNHTSWGSC